MLIQVDDFQKIQDLQDRFSLCFPTLKIEFCKRKHKWEEICPETLIYPSDELIGSIRKIHNPGVLEIKTWHKVGEIEKEFFKQLGLCVQIFYKNGNRWIQTGKSDNLTIRALEEKAYHKPKRLLL